jgi:hypothetical protein
MRTPSFSINDFFKICPNYSWTISHFFNIRRERIISGKAQLFEEGPEISYTHDLSTYLLTIRHQGFALHSQEVYTQKEILEAFERAKEKFFLIDLFAFSLDEMPFSIDEKVKRGKDYCFSKKVLKANHRGQKYRWKERRAIKAGTKTETLSRRRPLKSFNNSKVELEDFCELSTDSRSLKLKRDHLCDVFLTEGMNILMGRNGKIDALSFNPHYLGKRVIYNY